jgi:hypothetical protein
MVPTYLRTKRASRRAMRAWRPALFESTLAKLSVDVKRTFGL